MITEIISAINAAGGLARSNRFSVQIIPPRIFSQLSNQQTTAQKAGIVNQAAALGQSQQSLGDVPDYFKIMGLEGYDVQNRLDLMCLKGELPSKGFGTTDQRTYGSTFKMPHIDTYSDLTFHFIVGRDMFERHFFDAWSYTIQDPTSDDFNYVSEYGTTIDVYQLDEFDVSNYGCRLFQAWPIEIGPISLDYSDRNNLMVFPVTFTFRKWVNLKVNSGTPITIEPNTDMNGNTRTPNSFDSTVSLKQQR